ncbi:unnamed protein product [Vicia faba]|uniref:Uncharacterized protein n=1 Tax=Vicia faba TaxID=3906 RepID=A0AAV1AP83_VICFA|nr:unnamed protein product [Vicia faba]
MSYQPNLVAREFGLSQLLPPSLFSHPGDIVWVGRQLTAYDHQACLRLHKATQALDLPVFPFEHSFYTSELFDQWWSQFQAQNILVPIFLQRLADAFKVLDTPKPIPAPTPRKQKHSSLGKAKKTRSHIFY